MTENIEHLFYQFLDEIESGKNPDLQAPPYNSPDFIQLVKKYKKINYALKNIFVPADVSDFELKDYTVIKLIGQGGMGSVYLADDLKLNRKVAIKVIPKLNNQPLIERFKKESKILAKLKHPNIVEIFSCGETSDYFYYVMEYLEGVTLDFLIHLLKTKKVKNASDIFNLNRQPGDNVDEVKFDKKYFLKVAEIGTGIAHALEHAHKAGVLHRDIKPGNVILDNDFNVKVLDFGLGKILDDYSITLSHEMLGSPYYLSPEVIDNKPITPRSDIYALGVILYELITLRKPFEAPSLESLLSAIKNLPPRGITTFNKNIPKDLHIIIRTCMEKRPEYRYESMFVLLSELDNFLAGRPLRSSAYSISRLVLKTLSYNKKKIVFSAGVICILALGGLYYKNQASLERIREVEKRKILRSQSIETYLETAYIKFENFHISRRKERIKKLETVLHRFQDPLLSGLVIRLKLTDEYAVEAGGIHPLDDTGQVYLSALKKKNPGWLSVRLLQDITTGKAFETGYVSPAAGTFSDDYEDNFLTASLLEIMENYEEAIRLYEVSFNQNRKFYPAKVAQGVLYYLTVKPENAIRTLTSDAIPDKENPVSLVYLADIYTYINSVRDYVKAKEYYQKLLQRYPAPIFKYMYFCFLAKHSGNKDDVKKMYEENKHDSYVAGYYFDYMSSGALENNQYDTALVYIDRAIRAVEPNVFYTLYTARYHILMKLKRYKEALDSILKAKKLAKTTVDYFSNYAGDAYLAMKQYDKAEKNYQTLYKYGLRQKHNKLILWTAYDCLARLYKETNRKENLDRVVREMLDNKDTETTMIKLQTLSMYMDIDKYSKYLEQKLSVPGNEDLYPYLKMLLLYQPVLNINDVRIYKYFRNAIITQPADADRRVEFSRFLKNHNLYPDAEFQLKQAEKLKQNH